MLFFLDEIQYFLGSFIGFIYMIFSWLSLHTNSSSHNNNNRKITTKHYLTHNLHDLLHTHDRISTCIAYRKKHTHTHAYIQFSHRRHVRLCARAHTLKLYIQDTWKLLSKQAINICFHSNQKRPTRKRRWLNPKKCKPDKKHSHTHAWNLYWLNDFVHIHRDNHSTNTLKMAFNMPAFIFINPFEYKSFEYTNTRHKCDICVQSMVKIEEKMWKRRK